LKKYLIAFLAGALLTGTGVGVGAYLQTSALTTENKSLQAKLKKLNWQQDNLLKNQANLVDELNGYKENKAQVYDQTIGALMTAKENATLDALYAIGVKALREKDYTLAYFALVEVQAALPHYKELDRYFPESKQAYEKKQQALADEKLKNAYAAAYDYQAKGQFEQAKLNYQRVLEMNPRYKDAAARLQAVTRYLTVRQKSKEFEQKKQWLEASYKLGVNEQGQGRLLQAKQAFEAILKEAPHYRDVAKRFQFVNARLPKAPPSVQIATAPKPALNCYERGLAFGKCATAGGENANCSESDVARLQFECKGNPEFAKGLKAAVGGGRGEGGSVSAATLFKGLPSLLKSF